MKLFKSQKKNEENKQEQVLYPKVKTYSNAYGFSHADAAVKAQEPAAPAGNTVPFRMDERPYSVKAVPLPETVPPLASDDYNDPERIDLQDTLLTDESFVARIQDQVPDTADGQNTDPVVSSAGSAESASSA